MSAVSLVQFSSLNLNGLLTIGRQALDRNLAASADAAGHDPPLHHMLCISALKNPDARSAADAKPYLNLFHAGVMIAADERDFAEILELAGMPAAMVESINRGLWVAFVAGNLSQWRDAVLRGCQKEVSREVRHCYNLIYTEFKNIGLAAAFDFSSKPHSDSTFLLEYNA